MVFMEEIFKQKNKDFEKNQHINDKKAWKITQEAKS